MNALVDIGANLTNERFRADRAAVLARAREAGVRAIVITGVSEVASRRAWEIAEGGPRERSPVLLFSTAGIHPHNARTFERGSIDALRELAGRPEVVAIGECGLDYDRDFSPRDVQRRAFEAQLELAAEVGKAVFLHEREAHEDFAAILARWRPRLAGGVVHCFTSGERALERYLDLDLHVGITGYACDPRRGTHLLELVRRIPEGRLMIETDAPFLTPRVGRLPDWVVDRRNEPALLPIVLETLARARGEPPARLAEATTRAAVGFFGLKEGAEIAGKT